MAAKRIKVGDEVICINGTDPDIQANTEKSRGVGWVLGKIFIVDRIKSNLGPDRAYTVVWPRDDGKGVYESFVQLHDPKPIKNAKNWVKKMYGDTI